MRITQNGNAAQIRRRLRPDAVHVQKLLEARAHEAVQRDELREQFMGKRIGVFARDGIEQEDLEQLVILQMFRVAKALQHALSVSLVHNLTLFLLYHIFLRFASKKEQLSSVNSKKLIKDCFLSCRKTTEIRQILDNSFYKEYNELKLIGEAV